MKKIRIRDKKELI